jgi:hypothetical protein
VSLRHLLQRTALVLPVLALSSCAGLGRANVGLDRIDKVVERAVAVRDGCEDSKLSVHDTVEWLRAIVAHDFGGDAATAYEEFADAVKLSEKNAGILSSRVDAMDRAASSYFESWADEQWNFTSAEMRSRSQKRMTEARARYDTILAAIRPALTSYDTFNVAVHDIALFVGHDFTVAAELQREVRALARQATEIQDALQAAIEAADAYIKTTAIPVVRAEDEPDGQAAATSAQPGNR